MKPPSPELLALCGALRDETASPEEVSRLEHLLVSDPEARKFYLRFVQLEALLERYEKIPSLALLEEKTSIPERRTIPFRHFIAIAAGLALLGTVFFLTQKRPSRDADRLMPAVASGNVLAWVQETHDATSTLPSSPAKTVESGHGLLAGEVFTTGRSGAVIRPADEETLFILGPDTRVSFNHDGLVKVFHLEKGHFFCDVAEQRDGHRWSIVTSDGEATVLGTRLSVSTDPDGTEVAVTSGLVRVTTRTTRKSVETPAGFATKLTPSAATLTPLPPNEPTRIDSFSVVDSETATVIPGFERLADGAIIDLGALPRPARINIRANCEPRIVGGVRFALSAVDASNHPISLTHPKAIGFPKQTELFFPYMVAGDPPTGGGPPLAPYAWTPPAGNYTLTATPYAGEKGKGARGTALTIKFQVVDRTATP